MTMTNFDNFTMMIINYLKNLDWRFESSLSSFSQKWDYFTHNFKIYENFFPLELIASQNFFAWLS